MTEPSLQELKEQVLSEIQEKTETKIKTFKFESRQGFIVRNGQHVSLQQTIEETVNEFISSLGECKNINVKFQVARNFLPMTTHGEYEEIWYVLVIYEQ